MGSNLSQAKFCLKSYWNRLLIYFFDLKTQSELSRRNPFQQPKKDRKVLNRSILIKNGQFILKIAENN